MDGSPAGSPRRVLVTGAAGFIGSRVVRRYLADGVPVRAVVRPGADASAPGRAALAGAELVEADLRNPRGLADAVDGVDLVIHAAAVTRDRGRDERRIQDHPNVAITRHVIQASRDGGVPRLLHLSSTAAIGVSPDPRLPADEHTAFNLERLGLSYNTSKHAAERLVLQANGSRADGRALETVVVNPGVVFGTAGTRYMGGEVIARVLRAPRVVCTGGGLSMVHVDDLVAGVRRAAERGRAGERYILSGDNLSFRAIADVVCRVAGVRRTVFLVPNVARDLLGVVSNALARATGVGPNLALSCRFAYQYYSSEKARAELGYAPRGFDGIVADYLGAVGPDRR